MEEQAPKPLKLSCTRTDCANELHCFRTSKKLRGERREGSCRKCGKDLVNWVRVRQRDAEDVAFTFTALQHEFIRHYYFCEVQLDEGAVNRARRKGRKRLREAVGKHLLKAVGPEVPFRDGRQTPWRGSNPIHYAQHATASCCRKCVEEWHGIPVGQALNAGQIGYLADLAMRYLEQRVQLTDDGEHVPPIRKANPPANDVRGNASLIDGISRLA